MSVVNGILIWIHLVALAMGGAAAFGIPVVARMLEGASAEARPALFAAIKGISTVSRAGLGTLLVTGPLIVWLKYGGFDGFTWWFWLKMVLVVLLTAAVVYSGINARRVAAGDAAAARRGPLLGMASTALLVAVVLSAVFAFE